MIMYELGQFWSLNLFLEEGISFWPQKVKDKRAKEGKMRDLQITFTPTEFEKRLDS